MSPSTAINQCILSFPQACRRQTEESNFFVTDMYEYWNFVRRTLICLRGRRSHTLLTCRFCTIFCTIFCTHLVSINFLYHHTFLQTVSALGSGSMSLDPENNFGSPNLFSLFLPFHILLLHFFFLTPPWFYHFIFEMFSFCSYSFFSSLSL